MISRGRSWLDHPFLCTKYREREFYWRRRGAVSSASTCLKHASQWLLAPRREPFESCIACNDVGGLQEDCQTCTVWSVRSSVRT
jgi:hypothetical protein